MNVENLDGSPNKSIIKDVLVFGGIVFFIFFIFRPFVAEPYLVDGKSMDPTFSTGNYLIVDKISNILSNPERNSVVVFKYPGDYKNDPERNFIARFFNPGKSFIKRIIGLPGDRVLMVDNVVTIINAENPEGFKIDQSYLVHVCEINTSSCINTFDITLNSNEYFVMGDNREESFDSRYWGPLDREYILGKPILRLLPFKKFGTLPGDDKK